MGRPSRPARWALPGEPQQQAELFREQRVVVFEALAEQGERLGEVVTMVLAEREHIQPELLPQGGVIDSL